MADNTRGTQAFMDDEELIRIWETRKDFDTSTIAEMAQVKPTSLQVRVSKLRANGVPLTHKKKTARKANTGVRPKGKFRALAKLAREYQKAVKV